MASLARRSATATRSSATTSAVAGSPTRARRASVETWVADLEAVVDAAGIDRFALLGVSQGAAVALVYAARHPERVTALSSTAATRGAGWRGSRGARARGSGAGPAIRAGWADRRPDLPPRVQHALPPDGNAGADGVVRRAAAALDVGRRPPCGCIEARDDIDVVDVAPHVTAPTLVVHARGDRVVPVEEGRLLAARIPGRPLRPAGVGEPHPARRRAGVGTVPGSELDAFLGSPAIATPSRAVLELSPRELEVLELVAAGLTNEAIAERLS